MAPSASANSIWKQMNYTPPRGPCNHKESLLSPKCPCLRFMLHPLKVSSSFECDGCSHHASFHNMSSPADDATIARWKTTTEDQHSNHTHISLEATAPAPRPRKRPRRAIEAAPATPASTADGERSFAEDIALELQRQPRGQSQEHQRSWGERFSSWNFGREEEPVKTPPKKQAERRTVSGPGGSGNRRVTEQVEILSDTAQPD